MTSSPASPVPAAVADLLADTPPVSVSAKADRTAWARWLGDIGRAEPALAGLTGAIDRAEMCRQAEELIQGNQVVAAFVVTMVWGHGDSGYGPYRTRQVLTGARNPAGKSLDPGVAESLTESVKIARDEGAVEGFRHLNNRDRGRIKHLGPAFFTKWLYAATARGVHDHADAAPVLDDRVLRWVNANTDLTLRHRYTDDYAAYLAALKAWGASVNPARTAVGVEEAIFAATARD